jgi:hypothetical protein
MKALGLCLILAAVGLTSAWAQVTVEVTQDQNQFLPGEALITAVHITNRSGQTLHLGSDPDWLTFSVESRDHEEVVPKLGNVPVQGPFTLESSRVATKRVDLAPYFQISHVGRYAIRATVQIKAWKVAIVSQPLCFDIIDGAKLWEQEVGVPGTTTASHPVPEVRKYILQEANYLRAQLRLYVRLTDASGTKTFRVFPIGPMVSFSHPQPQVDQLSNLHLLYQDGAHTFSYTVIDPQGDIIARRTYDYVNTRPRLQTDAEGKIQVVGGVRLVKPTDVPPPKPETAAEEAPKPLPAPGEMVPTIR